jgi:hypothetical protein
MAPGRHRERTMNATLEPITVRPAYTDDECALRRLAALDSAAVPPAPLLVAEVAGELRAALSLWDGTTIADPFHLTAQHLELLRARAAMAQRHVGRRTIAWRRHRLQIA